MPRGLRRFHESPHFITFSFYRRQPNSPRERNGGDRVGVDGPRSWSKAFAGPPGLFAAHSVQKTAANLAHPANFTGAEEYDGFDHLAGFIILSQCRDREPEQPRALAFD